MDPQWTFSGDANLYRYVNNGPPNHTDSEGLKIETATGGVSEALKKALNYAQNNGFATVVAEIMDPKFPLVKVKDGTLSGQYDIFYPPSAKTPDGTFKYSYILWDPNLELHWANSNGEKCNINAAIILWHELGHFYYWAKKDPKKNYADHIKVILPDFENPLAKAVGEGIRTKYPEQKEKLVRKPMTQQPWWK
jgi:hypothetical protein